MFGLDQGWATSWTNSLNLLKKYFWAEILSKKSFVGHIGLEGLHWRVENKCLKAQISQKQVFVSGPQARHKITFIRDPHI